MNRSIRISMIYRENEQLWCILVDTTGVNLLDDLLVVHLDVLQRLDNLNRSTMNK